MKRIAALASVATLLLGAGSALAVGAANGNYQGTVNGTVKNSCGGNEGAGYFKVKNGGSKIVPLGAVPYCGTTITENSIVAPSDFACNQLNANLKAASIPISGGAFDYTGRAPIGPNGVSRNVRFKGAWQTAKLVTGYTRVQGGGCDSGKVHWRMTTPLP